MNLNKNNLITLIILDVLVIILAAGLLFYRFNSVTLSDVPDAVKSSKADDTTKLNKIRKSVSDMPQEKAETPKAAKKPLPASAPAAAPAKEPVSAVEKVTEKVPSIASRMAPNQKTRNIKFVFKHSKVKNVEIIGEFNAWIPQSMTKGSNNVWSITIQIPPGEYAYNFVIDGQPVRDPNNSKTSDVGRGFSNSLLKVKPLCERGKK